jgi:UDP-N-acetylglucosamine 1-carboxyvinyltransferase
MGADIIINGKTAVVTGREKLIGSEVAAHDLRAGAALIIAGIAAEGNTTVKNVHFVERGYENIVQKLTALGAKITRVED